MRWILAFIRFHDRKHPKELGKAEIEAFLSYLAMNRNAAASMQNQALSALVFLYNSCITLLRVDDAVALLILMGTREDDELGRDIQSV